VDIQGILGQAHQDIQVHRGHQDIQVHRGHQVLADIQVHRGHQVLADIQAFQDTVGQVYLDIQDLVALVHLVHLVGLAYQAGQGLAVFLDFLGKLVYQAHLVGQDFLVKLVHLEYQDGQVLAVYQDSVDQEYRDTQVLAVILASKAHPSTSKAQWPHQLICQQLVIFQMMHTLFHPMAICMFGVAQFGTMLAK
jgi:hypothetical protein